MKTIKSGFVTRAFARMIAARQFEARRAVEFYLAERKR